MVCCSSYYHDMSAIRQWHDIRHRKKEPDITWCRRHVGRVGPTWREDTKTCRQNQLQTTSKTATLPAKIPCIKEARWGRHEAQDSILLSMSNDLLVPMLSMTHTHTGECRRFERTGWLSPLTLPRSPGRRRAVENPIRWLIRRNDCLN